MGQYFEIVNITRKEFIRPHPFGDMAKFCELASSSYGFYLGLAILLRSVNGNFGYYSRGGNFLRSLLDYSDGRTISDLTDTPEDYNVPILCQYLGRWAGDQIIMMGDMYETGRFGEVFDDIWSPHPTYTDITDFVVPLVNLIRLADGLETI